MTEGIMGTQRAELVLSGLSCPACVRTVEEALRGVPGAESASRGHPEQMVLVKGGYTPT